MDIDIPVGKFEVVNEEELEEETAELEPSQPVEVAPITVKAPEAPPAPQKPPSKKGAGGKKKVLLAFGIAILVIAVAMGALILGPGEVTGLVVRLDQRTDHLEVNVLISTSSAMDPSGTATVSIEHSGTEVYNEDGWSINGKNALKQIPYEDFLVENGNYVVTVSFLGKEGTEAKNIEFLVTGLNIVFDQAEFVGNDPTFHIAPSYVASGTAMPGEGSFTIQSGLHEDGVTSVLGLPLTVQFSSFRTAGYNGHDLRHTKSGNYTFTILVENDYAKDDSALSSFTIQTTTLINTHPEPRVTSTEDDGENDHHLHLSSGQTTVTLDASGTLDDSTDLTFDWFFYDSQTHEYGQVVSHTYNSIPPQSQYPDGWPVLLTITDDAHGEAERAPATWTEYYRVTTI